LGLARQVDYAIAHREQARSHKGFVSNTNIVNINNQMCERACSRWQSDKQRIISGMRNRPASQHNAGVSMLGELAMNRALDNIDPQ